MGCGKGQSWGMGGRGREVTTCSTRLDSTQLNSTQLHSMHEPIPPPPSTSLHHHRLHRTWNTAASSMVDTVMPAMPVIISTLRPAVSMSAMPTTTNTTFTTPM